MGKVEFKVDTGKRHNFIVRGQLNNRVRCLAGILTVSEGTQNEPFCQLGDKNVDMLDLDCGES